MGQKDVTSFSDHGSGKTLEPPRRGRPPVPRAAILEAADALLARAPAPAAVSMDEIAVAAGVGKGTLFRAFGNRAGLIRALVASRVADLRAAVESGPPPLGPAAPPTARLVAICDELITFKLEGPHLMLALGLTGEELFASPFYVWLHALLSELLAEAVPDAEANFAAFGAHAVLGMMRIDVTTELRTRMGMSPDDLRRTQAAFIRQLTGVAGD